MTYAQYKMHVYMPATRSRTRVHTIARAEMHAEMRARSTRYFMARSIVQWVGSMAPLR